MPLVNRQVKSEKFGCGFTPLVTDHSTHRRENRLQQMGRLFRVKVNHPKSDYVLGCIRCLMFMADGQCTTLRSSCVSTITAVETQHEPVTMPWVLHWDSTQRDSMVFGGPGVGIR
jgi:hypothetical protein